MARRNLRLTDEDVDGMVLLYQRGLSTTEIGRIYACLGGSVWIRLKKRGVALRPPRFKRHSWFITEHGYVRYGKDYLHRLVASAWLGRDLKDGEVVHHKDGDRINNHPENLEVIANNGIHVAMHISLWSPEDDWILILSRDRGSTAAQIAECLGVSKAAVDNRATALRKKGMTPLLRNGWGGDRRRLPSAVIWAIQEMRSLGVDTRSSLLSAANNPGAAAVRGAW